MSKNEENEGKNGGIDGAVAAAVTATVEAEGRQSSSVVLREDVVLPISVVVGAIAIAALFSGRYLLSLQLAFLSLGLLWMASKFYNEGE